MPARHHSLIAKFFRCLLLGTVTLPLLLAETTANAGEIRLGSSAAASGPAAQLGLRYHAGASAYFAKVNQQGGIGGAKIVIDQLDDGYEPDKTEANTRKLVEDSSIVALFGYVGTPTSYVALPYVRRGKIPFVGAYTGAAILRDPADAYVFNVRASYDEEALQLASAMKSAGKSSLNILYQLDTFGRSGLESMSAAANKAGMKIITTTGVERNTTNVEGDVDLLVNKSPADAIFMVSTYGTCAAFIRLAREKGFKGQFYTLSFAGLEPLRAALKGDMRGVTVAQVMPNPEDRSLAVVVGYQKAMRESGDTHFDSISLEGYISAQVMVEGLRKAKTPITRATVIDGLESLGKMDLGGFYVHLGPKHHNGSSLVELISNK